MVLRCQLCALAIAIIGSIAYGSDGTEGVPDFDWKTSLVTIPVAKVAWPGNSYGSPWYQDTMTHSVDHFEKDTPTTNCHETTHLLNGAMRISVPGHVNAFYVGDGKGAIVPEPAMSPRIVRNYVPYQLQSSSRYQLYIINQADTVWSNSVLYVLDEWSGYHSDLRAAVEVVKAGNLAILGGEICIGDGAVEFLHFASAAVAALKDNEPEYLKNLQFKSEFAYFAEETVNLVKINPGIQTFDCKATQYLELFRTSPEADHNRQVIREWMGPTWTKRVLGY